MQQTTMSVATRNILTLRLLLAHAFIVDSFGRPSYVIPSDRTASQAKYTY